MWEMASMCVLLGGESNKATAVISVLPKFYHHTYPIKCPPNPSLEGHLFEYCSICYKKWYYINTIFAMLMWETASMCVLLGGKSNKATAVFPVLYKFYQHTYPIKCPPTTLGRALTSNTVVFVRENGITSKQFLEC